MSQTYSGGAMHIVSTGVSAATGAASARSAIPVDASGNRPKYIRVAARNESYVKLGDSDAADGMLKSKWATQTPNRAKRLAEQMKTGVWQYAPGA